MSDTLPTRTGTGLAPNVAGALSYLLGPITGVLFLVLDRESRFVRFHAVQSIVVGLIWIALSVALSIVSTVLLAIPVIGWIVGLVLSMAMALGGLLLWLLLMWKAFQGEEWEVPVAGPIAHRQAASA